MELPPLGTGAHESPTSIQDIHAHQVLDMAPLIYSEFEIVYRHPHFNQRAIGVCTAADLVDMAQKIWGMEFSVSFTYWGGKEYDGNLLEGSSNLSMLRHAKNVGFLPLIFDDHGNDTHGTYDEYVARKKTYTPEQLQQASLYRLSGYATCPLDPLGFAQTLQNSKYGVLTRMAVGSNFYSPSWDKSDLELLKAPNPVTGGHSIKVTAHNGVNNKQTRKLRNSWGDAQNPTTDNGLVWCGDGDIKYEYDTQQPYVTEAHIVFADPITFKHKFSVGIHQGETSAEVVALQRILMQYGYLKIPQGVKLGTYGPLTKSAVLDFQIKNGVTPNNGGIAVGPKTVLALNTLQGL